MIDVMFKGVCHPWLEVLALHRNALALLDRGSCFGTFAVSIRSSTRPDFARGFVGRCRGQGRLIKDDNIMGLMRSSKSS